MNHIQLTDLQEIWYLQQLIIFLWKKKKIPKGLLFSKENKY